MRITYIPSLYQVIEGKELQMDEYLPSEYQRFIHLSRYSRWLNDEKRRETWPETVGRYFDFFQKHLKENCDYEVTPRERKELEGAVLRLDVMPSMRCLMTAGPALERENISGYNCSYVTVNRVRAFDEILYVLMCGTGVGFSVERQYVSELPPVAEDFHATDTTIIVADSKVGWAKAYKELVSLLWAGQIPKWDTSRVRPSGARLKTFGGRASGPGPLEDLFRFTVAIMQQAAGRKLTSLEAHDIVCKIADVVVVGGVRRAALISLSNLSDDRMRHAKSGRWWDENRQRQLANNSAAYDEKPDMGIFMDEWKALYDSKSGERGIFNRAAANKKILADNIRELGYKFGTNPCGEIILRDREFCNLSEIIARAVDDMARLIQKTKWATILGTWQATLTNFKYVTKEWAKNCTEERLLGVSLTGMMDNHILYTADRKDMYLLQKAVTDTNKTWAKKLGINTAAAATCVKPSGTVSQLVDASPGINARHSPYYIRTVRADNNDPLCQFMKDKGFPWEPDIGKPDHMAVFSFPVKSPKGAITRTDRGVLDQLEHWHKVRRYWTQHNPSVTIDVKEHEWMIVGSWVYSNFDDIAGIAFLPFTEHVYQQAPYQECDKDKYEEVLKAMPKDVDWSKMSDYESEDGTIGSQELACHSGVCEIVDLVAPTDTPNGV